MLEELLKIIKEAAQVIENLELNRESLEGVYNDLKDVDHSIEQHQQKNTQL